jgi:hypothetical protein
MGLGETTSTAQWRAESLLSAENGTLEAIRTIGTHGPGVISIRRVNGSACMAAFLK